MTEHEKIYGDWLFYVIVIAGIAVCGMSLHYLGNKTGDPVFNQAIGMTIISLGCMSVTFSIGLLWNKRPNIMKNMDSSLLGIMGLFFFGKDIVKAVQKGINYSLLVNVILVMLMLLVLPFYIGRWISLKRPLRSVENECQNEQAIGGE